MKIAILAAFPHELKMIRTALGGARRISWRPFPVQAAARGNAGILLVETGMKPGNVAGAFAQIRELGVNAVVSAGFAGALYPGAAAGELAAASECLLWSHAGVSPETSISLPICGAEIRSDFVSLFRNAQRVFLTIPHLTPKRSIVSTLPLNFPPSVCDMETYFLAKLCRASGTALFGLRFVSDDLNEDIPTQFQDVCDTYGMFRLSRAILLAASNPGLISSMQKLRRNTEKGAGTLGEAVLSVVDLIIRAGAHSS